ncbi:SsgA family sporulation/cell division regulator [Streptomyces sp. Y7]|uniref:SsgA family sporulation/cell division regulator n=1 Tax=Streptomyces sp. Y7 TaxID=3342392 RepID=UPI00371C644E
MLDTKLLLTSGGRITVRTRLVYDTRNPFAVSLVFHADTDSPTLWVMARDLLAQGLRRPNGQGDVRVWPTGSGLDAELNLVLASPHGTARLTAPHQAVARWLEHTYRLVPAGRESGHFDLENELRRLLHGTA